MSKQEIEITKNALSSAKDRLGYWKSCFSKKRTTFNFRNMATYTIECARLQNLLGGK